MPCRLKFKLNQTSMHSYLFKLQFTKLIYAKQDGSNRYSVLRCRRNFPPQNTSYNKCKGNEIHNVLKCKLQTTDPWPLDIYFISTLQWNSLLLAILYTWTTPQAMFTCQATLALEELNIRGKSRIAIDIHDPTWNPTIIVTVLISIVRWLITKT